MRGRDIDTESAVGNTRLMRTPAVVAFVLVFLVANVACHREAAHPAAPKPAPQEVPSFDADKVDITFDWDSTPIGGRPKGDSPIKLTASDGTGLQLMSLEARAVLYGPLAFTELHLAFDNNQPRTREGTFSIQLPEGAAVSRFAMKVGYNWQEGEVVEREAARATYETFVHRKVDPAMLVRDSGNVFRGRVFPISPDSERRSSFRIRTSSRASTSPIASRCEVCRSWRGSTCSSSCRHRRRPSSFGA